MTTTMITFEYRGNNVAFDPAAQMWNLNAMHQAAGGTSHKSPHKWLGQVQANELLAALAEEEAKLGEISPSFVITREGRNGGTWAHWQIAAAYAHYLDARFYLQWNRWAMERAQQVASGDGTAPLARVEALAYRVAKLEGMRSAQAQSHRLLDLTADDETQILAQLVITHHRADRLTTTEIAAHLSAQGIDLGASLHGQQMIIAVILKRAGVVQSGRRNVANGRARAWVGVTLACV